MLAATPLPLLFNRYEWGSCETPNKVNIERFTSLLAKCMKKAVDAGKDIAVLAHLDWEKVSLAELTARPLARAAQPSCTAL